MAQRLKHLSPMRETQVQSVSREDPLEKEMVTHSSILAWRIPGTEKPGRRVHRVAKSWTQLSDFTSTFTLPLRASGSKIHGQDTRTFCGSGKHFIPAKSWHLSSKCQWAFPPTPGRWLSHLRKWPSSPAVLPGDSIAPWRLKAMPLRSPCVLKETHN